MAAIPNPSCPRCGYDQTGVVESWAESCPLAGVCSECGLAFDWLDVLRPGRIHVPGFFEHAVGPSFRGAWRTLLWTCWPGWFWSRVRLEHSVHPRRLALWLLVLLVPFQIMHITSAVGFRLWVGAQASALRTQSAPFGTAVWDGIVPQCLQPLVTLDRSFYGFQPTPTVNGPFSRAVPGWHDRPLLTASLLCMSLTLPGMLVCLPQTRARAKVHMRHIARATTYGMGWLVVLAGLRLISEIGNWWVTLTTTIPPPAGIPAITWFMGAQMNMFQTTVWDRVMSYQAAVAVIVGLWLAWWWWIALRRGFRIAQPFAVWLSMLVPSVLITVAVLSVLSPHAVGNLVDSVFQWRHFPR